jgi:hypothetical protein
MIFQNTKLSGNYPFQYLILPLALAALVMFSSANEVRSEALFSVAASHQITIKNSQADSKDNIQVGSEENNQTSIRTIHQRRIARPEISTDSSLAESDEAIKRTSSNSFALEGKTNVFLQGDQTNAPLCPKADESGLLPLRSKTADYLRANINHDDNQKMLKSWVILNHPKALAMFENLSADAIINVLGKSDHEEDNKDLRGLGLKFLNIKPKELETTNFSNARVVILNCDGPSYEPKDNPQLVKFIRDGGCLIETDWAATDWLCVHFRDQFKAKECLSGPILAKVNFGDLELTKGCAPEGVWLMRHGLSWCEYSGNTFEVTPIPLAEGTTPSGLHVVPAFYFQCGKGWVLHLAGHYDPTFSDAVPSMGVSIRQALLLNFLIYALDSQASQLSLSKSRLDSGGKTNE